MSGYAGMCVAALIAAPELPVLTGTARIVVVMIALNIFVASFAPGSISRRSRKVHVHRPGWTYECPAHPDRNEIMRRLHLCPSSARSRRRCDGQVVRRRGCPVRHPDMPMHNERAPGSWCMPDLPSHRE